MGPKLLAAQAGAGLELESCDSKSPLPQLPRINSQCARLGKHPVSHSLATRLLKLGNASPGQSPGCCWKPVGTRLPVLLDRACPSVAKAPCLAPVFRHT